LFRKGGASGIPGTGGATSGSGGSGAATGGGNEPSGGKSAAGERGSLGGSAGLSEPSGGATHSGGSNSGHAGSTGGSAAGSSGSSAGGTGAGGASSTGSGGVATAGSGGEGVEVCDALDNDANGVIDDLDEKGDGVCDCLRIATLGFPGTWGSGHFISNWLKPLAPHARIDALEGEVLTAETLAGYDIVFALNASQTEINRSYTADEVRTLAAWVKDGGGLMTLIGFSEATELANVNLLLAAFDLHYESSAIFIRPGTMPVSVTEFAVHPITAGVTAVGMDNGYEPRGTGTVYAMKNQVNIGIAQEFGKGHVDVWADEWITYANQWKDRAEYDVPRFWLNTIHWLTPSGVCKVPMPSTLP
jgi:hypothetical protein